MAVLKNVRQLVCVFEDTEPPESLPFLRKSPTVLGSSTVHKSNAASCIRENRGPSLGKMQVKVPHQRSPHAVKFEDRSQEETERQERCARGDAWRLAKNFLMFKEKNKATFFSPTNEWCLPAPSVIKPEEREFVVDSGAPTHMLSRNDLNSAELETLRVFKNPTTVVATNGDVQTKDEATVYVKELDLFVTLRLLDDTLTRKTLPMSRIILRVDHWPEATAHQRWQTDKMQHGEPRSHHCPWFIDKLFKLS